MRYPFPSATLLLLLTLCVLGCESPPPPLRAPAPATTVIYADTFDLFHWRPKGMRRAGGPGSWEITRLDDSITKVRLQLHRKEATYLSFRRDGDRVKFDMEGARKLNFSDRFLDLFEKDSSIIYTHHIGVHLGYELLLMNRHLEPMLYVRTFPTQLPNFSARYLIRNDSLLVQVQSETPNHPIRLKEPRDPDSVWAFLKAAQNLPPSEVFLMPSTYSPSDPCFLQNERNSLWFIPLHPEDSQ